MHLGLVAGDLDDHTAHPERWGRRPDRRRRAGLCVARSRATRARTRRVSLARWRRRVADPARARLGSPAATTAARRAARARRRARRGCRRAAPPARDARPRARARPPRWPARAPSAPTHGRPRSRPRSSIARAAAPAAAVAASARRRSASASAAARPALALARGGEQLLEPQALGGDGRARGLDDLGVEPETRRHLQRVRGAGAPDGQRERRRERGGVEPDRRVLGALVACRPLLELGVVGRHERLCATRLQRLEQRLRERRALDRVGARRDLVEQHERARPGDRDDRGDRPQVARERREAARDRLLVADVREDLLEHGQPRRASGWSQPALVERGCEPERLQRDGLAARVRARHDERAHARERQVDRDRRPRLEQRMARLDQHDVVVLHDGAAARALREPSRGHREVELRDRVDGRGHVGRRCADLGGQGGEDARDLLALLARELAQPVVLLDERERLDEQRLTRARRVVDDPRHRASRIRANREHGPAAALGQELLLQVRAQARGHLPQSLGGPLARDRVLASQRTELRRGAVADALLIDRLLDRERELVESGCDRVRARREQRKLLAPARRGCDAPRARRAASTPPRRAPRDRA